MSTSLGANMQITLVIVSILSLSFNAVILYFLKKLISAPTPFEKIYARPPSVLESNRKNRVIKRDENDQIIQKP